MRNGIAAYSEAQGITLTGLPDELVGGDCIRVNMRDRHARDRLYTNPPLEAGLPVVRALLLMPHCATLIQP